MYEKRKPKISKVPFYDFSNLLSASSGFDGSDGDSLFKRNENMKSTDLTISLNVLFFFLAILPH